jgi:L-ribulose-5-phosphate 3-epimerase
MLIGIMQGRLLPPEPDRFQAFPRSGWEREFGLAQAAALQSIEWIYDAYGADINPIATDEGIEHIGQLALENRVSVLSLCADYFMDIPALDPKKLVWLLERCSLAKISRIVLPFVDASRIESPEHAQRVISILRELLPEATRLSVEIHLETSLDPASFAALLDALPHPLLRANYDSGNSASLGYLPSEEFAAYGERIASVHIKDRVRNGGTVPLGTGAADFSALFRELKRVKYNGDFILQTARETAGDELALARRNLSWLQLRIAQL